MKLIKLSVLAVSIALAACAAKPAMTESKTEIAAPAADAGMNHDAMDHSAMAHGAMDAQKQSGFESRMTEVLAMPHRSAENRARDKYRHPAETLSFFGLTDTQTVIEITPGGGWYAEVLAPLLGANGHYIAAIPDPAKASSKGAMDYYTKQNAELDAKFKSNADVYGRAAVVLMDGKAPNFGAPGSADVVLTFRNAHNWMSAGTEALMFKAFFDVLKPGGKLGMTDHRAAPGTDWKVSAKTGYVSEESVIKLALAAGFVLAGKSEINANLLDTKDYEGGVWTLPPTLGEGEKNKAKYLAIGESDRMTLLFTKP
jgi:predicted methyltransferase